MKSFDPDHTYKTREEIEEIEKELMWKKLNEIPKPKTQPFTAAVNSMQSFGRALRILGYDIDEVERDLEELKNEKD